MMYKHTLGTIISFVYGGIDQINEILVFLLFCTSLLAAFIKSLGYDIVPQPRKKWDERKDVSNENSIFNYFINIFNNGVGNLIYPTYPYFKAIIDRDMVESPSEQEVLLSSVMVLIIWVIWILSIMFLLILICNIMIAFIS